MQLPVVLVATCIILGINPQQELPELPPRNEAVIRLLNEAAIQINSFTGSNRAPIYDLILCYLDAGDYNKALATLLHNRKKLNYPILDTSYWVQASGRINTANRLIRDYYAAIGEDIFQTKLNRSSRERFEVMAVISEEQEILDWIDQFQIASSRAELIETGIKKLGTRQERLELAQRLARHPDANLRLEHWAQYLGVALARNGDLQKANRLAKRLLDRISSFEKKSVQFSPYQRGLRGASEIYAAIAVQQSRSGQRRLAEQNYALAHSLAPVFAERFAEGDRFDLALHHHRNTRHEAHANQLQMVTNGGYVHPLARASKLTDDVLLKEQLVSAIQQPELKMPALIEVLRFIAQANPQHPNSDSITQRLQQIAKNCLSEMPDESLEQAAAALARYLFDADKISQGIAILDEYVEDELHYDLEYLYASGAAIGHGHLQEGLSLADQSTCREGSFYRPVLKALVEAKRLEFIPEILNRNCEDQPQYEYELGRVIQAMSKNYPWRESWEFARKLYGDSWHPANARGIFRQIARLEAPQQVSIAYRFMRENNIDAYHLLLTGLTENGHLKAASRIMIDLIENPPDKQLQNGFADKKLVLAHLVEQGDFQNAWKLAYHQSSIGEQKYLVIIFRELLKNDRGELVDVFLNSPPPYGTRGSRQRLDHAIRQLSLAQAMILVSDEK